MYTLTQVDQNTWTFEDRLPSGGLVRYFVLDGADTCLVLDTGHLPEDVHGRVAELLKAEGRDKDSNGEEKPILLANTHGDGDHVGGNYSFANYYITQTDYERCNVAEKVPNVPYTPVEDGMYLDLGGRKLQFFFAPGHTYGNIVVLDITNRVLFPGDMVQDGFIYMFGPHRCPDQLAKSLELLRDKKAQYDKFYPCHGSLELPADAVDEVIASWQKVLNHEVEPVEEEVIGMKVHTYYCGFCNFYCNAQ